MTTPNHSTRKLLTNCLAAVSRRTGRAAAALALAVGIFAQPALAADPVVAWNGDFGTATKIGTDGGTYTLDLQSNTQTDGKITISQTVAPKITLPSDFGPFITVVMKYSGYKAPSADASILAVSQSSGCSDIGLYIHNAGGSIAGYYDNTGNFGSKSLSIPSSGYLALTYSCSTSDQGGVRGYLGIESDGAVTYSGRIGQDGLRFTHASDYYLTSVNLGGSAADASRDAIQGLVIEGVAIYNSRLDANAVSAAVFPDIFHATLTADTEWSDISWANGKASSAITSSDYVYLTATAGKATISSASTIAARVISWSGTISVSAESSITAGVFRHTAASTIENTAALTVNAAFAGSTQLNKDGAGTMTVVGTGTMTGNVEIKDGKVILSGEESKFGTGWFNVKKASASLDIEPGAGHTITLTPQHLINSSVDNSSLNIGPGTSVIATTSSVQYGSTSRSTINIANGGEMKVTHADFFGWTWNYPINIAQGGTLNLTARQTFMKRLNLNGGTLKFSGVDDGRGFDFYNGPTVAVSADSTIQAEATTSVANPIVWLRSNPTFNVAANATLNFNAEIGGGSADNGSSHASETNNKGFTKTGAGTIAFNGCGENKTYTYNGTTTINAGEVQMNGTHTSGSAYTIASGAKLSGTGTVTSTITCSGGTVDVSSGLDLSGSTLNLSSGSTIKIGNANVTLGVVTAAGTLNIDGSAISSATSPLTITGGSGSNFDEVSIAASLPSGWMFKGATATTITFVNDCTGAEAEIGTTKYASLSDALSAAAAGETVKVLADGMVISNAVSTAIYLDINGHETHVYHQDGPTTVSRVLLPNVTVKDESETPSTLCFYGPYASALESGESFVLVKTASASLVVAMDNATYATYDADDGTVSLSNGSAVLGYAASVTMTISSEVTTAYFGTLAGALTYAGSDPSATIAVLNDVNTSSTDYTIPAGVTLSLGANTLTCGTLTLNGTMEVVSGSAVAGAVSANSATAKISGTGAALQAFAGNVTSLATASGATLTLECTDGASYEFNKAISGAGAVAVSGGTVTFKQENTFTGGLLVKQGTTAKGDGVRRFGPNGGAITVEVGGTLDVNYTSVQGTGVSYAITIVEGDSTKAETVPAITNSGTALVDEWKQTSSITVNANATVECPSGKNWGILAGSYGQSYLKIKKGVTLRKTGEGTFWITNTELGNPAEDSGEGNGVLEIVEGTVNVLNKSHSTASNKLASGAAFEIKVDQGATLSVNKSFAVSKLTVSGNVNVVSTATITFAEVAGTSTGNVVYTGKVPDTGSSKSWTDSGWQGTLTIKNVESTADNLFFSNYGNTGSTLELIGVTCHHAERDTSDVTMKVVAPTVKLTNGTGDHAFGYKSNNGWSNNYTTFRKLIGSGKFMTSGGNQTQHYIISDASEFYGDIDVGTRSMAIGTTTTKTSGKIVVDAGATVAVQPGVRWTASSGIEINGTINARVAVSAGTVLIDGSSSTATIGDSASLSVNGEASGLLLNAADGDVVAANPPDLTIADGVLTIDDELVTNLGVFNITYAGESSAIKVASSSGQTLFVTAGELLYDRSVFDGSLSSDVTIGAGATLRVRTVPGAKAAGLRITTGTLTIDSGATVKLGDTTYAAGQYSVEGGYIFIGPETTILPLGDSITEGGNNSKTASCTTYESHSNYRTILLEKLGKEGYNPRALGFWNVKGWMKDGTDAPDRWTWQAGMYGHRIVTVSGKGTSTGMMDAIDAIMDAAGYPDVITFNLGVNDLSDAKLDEVTFNNWTNLVTKIHTLRPNARIVATRLMDWGTQADPSAEQIAAVTAFNNRVAAWAETSDAAACNVTLINLREACPNTSDNFHSDRVHPNWTGQTLCANAWAEGVKAVLEPEGRSSDTFGPEFVRNSLDLTQKKVFVRMTRPVKSIEGATATLTGGENAPTLSSPAIESDGRTVSWTASAALNARDQWTVNVSGVMDWEDAPTSGTATLKVAAYGAEANVPEGYLAQFVKQYEIYLPATGQHNNNNDFTYTTVAAEPVTRAARVGYFLQLEREGRNEIRYVWADMDAFQNGVMTNMRIPTTTQTHQIADNLHVYSNSSNIENVQPDDDSVKGVIEFTQASVSHRPDSSISGMPSQFPSISSFGWNDTIGTGEYGSMQIHRIAPTSASGRYMTSTSTGAMAQNPAEVLFAYNAWNSTGATAAEIGIGNFGQAVGQANGQTADNVGLSYDYTFTYWLPKMCATGYKVRKMEFWAVPATIAYNVSENTDYATLIADDVASGAYVEGVMDVTVTLSNDAVLTLPASSSWATLTVTGSGSIAAADIDSLPTGLTIGTGVSLTVNVDVGDEPGVTSDKEIITKTICSAASDISSHIAVVQAHSDGTAVTGNPQSSALTSESAAGDYYLYYDNGSVKLQYVHVTAHKFLPLTMTYGSTTASAGTFITTATPSTPAFEGITLKDIRDNYCVRGITGGGNIASGMPMLGFNRYVDETDGTINYIRYEMQARDGEWIKCVVIKLTESGGNVYAQALNAYHSKTADAQDLGVRFLSDDATGTVQSSNATTTADTVASDNTTEVSGHNYYGVCGLTISRLTRLGDGITAYYPFTASGSATMNGYAWNGTSMSLENSSSLNFTINNSLVTVGNHPLFSSSNYPLSGAGNNCKAYDVPADSVYPVSGSASDWTISLWAKRDGNSVVPPLYYYGTGASSAVSGKTTVAGNANGGIGIWHSGTVTAQFSVTTDGSSFSTYEITSASSYTWSDALANWHHVALVRSGTTVTLYVDGAATGSPVTIDEAAYLVKPTGAKLTLSKNEALGPQNSLDDLCFWSRALTAAEISALNYKNSNRARPIAALAGFDFANAESVMFTSSASSTTGWEGLVWTEEDGDGTEYSWEGILAAVAAGADLTVTVAAGGTLNLADMPTLPNGCELSILGDGGTISGTAEQLDALASSAASVTVNSGKTLTLACTDDGEYAFAKAIAGDGTLVLDGGTAALTVAPACAGGVTVKSGTTFDMETVAAISGNLTVESGATLNLYGTSTAFALSTSGTLSVDSGAVVNVNGSAIPNGSYTVANGTLTLSGVYFFNIDSNKELAAAIATDGTTVFSSVVGTATKIYVTVTGNRVLALNSNVAVANELIISGACTLQFVGGVTLTVGTLATDAAVVVTHYSDSGAALTEKTTIITATSSLALAQTPLLAVYVGGNVATGYAYTQSGNNAYILPTSKTYNVSTSQTFSALIADDIASGDYAERGMNVTVNLTDGAVLTLDAEGMAKAASITLGGSNGTLKVTSADLITGEFLVPAGVVLDLAGTMTLGESTKIYGDGKVLVSAGTVTASGSNGNGIKTHVDVAQGATLKLGSFYGLGGNHENGSGKTITVYGTLDTNGKDGVNAYVLAGGTLKNDASHVGKTSRQTGDISLVSNSWVNAAYNYGQLASGFAQATLNLNGHVLTKTGSSEFWMCHVVTDDAAGGRIVVADGTLNVTPGGENHNQGNSANLSTTKVPIEVQSDATLSVNCNSTFAELTGSGTVSSNKSSVPVVSTLDLTDGLSVTCAVSMPDGATIKIDDDGATISGKVTAAGTLNIDGSAITAEKTASKDEITLTVGTGSNLSLDNVKVANARPGWYVKSVAEGKTVTLAVSDFYAEVGENQTWADLTWHLTENPETTYTSAALEVTSSQIAQLIIPSGKTITAPAALPSAGTLLVTGEGELAFIGATTAASVSLGDGMTLSFTGNTATLNASGVLTLLGNVNLVASGATARSVAYIQASSTELNSCGFNATYESATDTAGCFSWLDASQTLNSFTATGSGTFTFNGSGGETKLALAGNATATVSAFSGTIKVAGTVNEAMFAGVTTAANGTVYFLGEGLTFTGPGSLPTGRSEFKDAIVTTPNDNWNSTDAFQSSATTMVVKDGDELNINEPFWATAMKFDVSGGNLNFNHSKLLWGDSANSVFTMTGGTVTFASTVGLANHDDSSGVLLGYSGSGAAINISGGLFDVKNADVNLWSGGIITLSGANTEFKTKGIWARNDNNNLAEFHVNDGATLTLTGTTGVESNLRTFDVGGGRILAQENAEIGATIITTAGKTSTLESATGKTLTVNEISGNGSIKIVGSVETTSVPMGGRLAADSTGTLIVPDGTVGVVAAFTAGANLSGLAVQYASGTEATYIASDEEIFILPAGVTVENGTIIVQNNVTLPIYSHSFGTFPIQVQAGGRISVDEEATPGGELTLENVTWATDAEKAVVVTHFNDTTTNVTATVGSGSTALVEWDPQIDGNATMIDMTFTNTCMLAHCDEGLAELLEPAQRRFKFDGWDTPATTNASYNNDLKDKSTAIHMKWHPYLWDSSAVAGYLAEKSENTTFAIVGTMPTTTNTVFCHIGSSRVGNDPEGNWGKGNGGMIIYTTAKPDEVVIAAHEATNIFPITTMTVPNSDKARHSYVITKKSTVTDTYSNMVFTIYIDGIKWKTVPMEYAAFNKAHGGIQVGSDFGGKFKDLYNEGKSVREGGIAQVPRDATEKHGGLVNCIRIYDRILTEKEAKQYAREDQYPYVSPTGSATRTVTSATEDTTWVQGGKWTITPVSEGEAAYQAEKPIPQTEINIIGNAAATLQIAGLENPTEYDTLNVSGSAEVTISTADMSGGQQHLYIAGITQLHAPLRVKNMAIRMSTAPVAIYEGGSLTFDFSDFTNVTDFGNFMKAVGGDAGSTEHLELTGETEKYDAKQIRVVPPNFTYGESETHKRFELKYDDTKKAYTLYMYDADVDHKTWEIHDGTMQVSLGMEETDTVLVNTNAALDVYGIFKSPKMLYLNGGILFNSSTNMPATRQQYPNFTLLADSYVEAGEGHDFASTPEGGENAAAFDFTMNGHKLYKIGEGKFTIVSPLFDSGALIVSNGTLSITGNLEVKSGSSITNLVFGALEVPASHNLSGISVLGGAGGEVTGVGGAAGGTVTMNSGSKFIYTGARMVGGVKKTALDMTDVTLSVDSAVTVLVDFDEGASVPQKAGENCILIKADWSTPEKMPKGNFRMVDSLWPKWRVKKEADGLHLYKRAAMGVVR